MWLFDISSLVFFFFFFEMLCAMCFFRDRCGVFARRHSFGILCDADTADSIRLETRDFVTRWLDGWMQALRWVHETKWLLVVLQLSWNLIKLVLHRVYGRFFYWYTLSRFVASLFGQSGGVNRSLGISKLQLYNDDFCYSFSSNSKFMINLRYNK